ncbi:hypothetical protein QR680_005766 [Steinernema hermaphroditum]|uniref:Uncharacterized protein n=1 Tax=Steinernema hermaphroditum TaxID=289476 RepID=A0AA39LVG9_9BILA|nr:hypothetical protein QR680_005766 [Steinernema hermaphroditum]
MAGKEEAANGEQDDVSFLRTASSFTSIRLIKAARCLRNTSNCTSCTTSCGPGQQKLARGEAPGVDGPHK